MIETNLPKSGVAKAYKETYFSDTITNTTTSTEFQPFLNIQQPARLDAFFHSSGQSSIEFKVTIDGCVWQRGNNFSGESFVAIAGALYKNAHDEKSAVRGPLIAHESLIVEWRNPAGAGNGTASYAYSLLEEIL
jgi:hypothetical protein